MSSQMNNSELLAIQAWVEETEQVISSQSCFDTFQPAEVKEIVSRFKAVLDSNLDVQQVSQMPRAITLLIFVTKNSRTAWESIINLLKLLMSHFFASESKDQLLRSVGDEVLEAVAQYGEDIEAKNAILEQLFGDMLSVVTDRHVNIYTQKSWLKTLNSVLSGSDIQLRKMLAEEFSRDIDLVVDLLYTCGDYDMQSSLIETMLRLTTKANRPELCTAWFPNYALVQSLFVRIKEFETDCRNFLNCFNQGLGNNQLVFPFPALTCQVGDQNLYKPPDAKYRNFWVDFNLGSASVSIFHVKDEDSKDLWDMFTITQAMVSSSSVVSQAGSTVLTLTLLSGQAVITFPATTTEQTLHQLVSQLFPSKSAAISTRPGHNNSKMKCSRAEDQAYLGIRSPHSTTVKTPSPVSQVRFVKRDSAISSVKGSGKSSVAEFSVKVGVDVEQERVENYTKCSKTELIKLLDKQDTSREKQVGSNYLETYKVISGKKLGLADEINLDDAIKKCFVRLTKLRNVDVETVLTPHEMLVDSSQGNGENLDDQMVRTIEENVGSKSRGKENIDTNEQVAMSTINNTFKENDVEIGIVNLNLENKAKQNVFQRRNLSTEGKDTDKHQHSSVKQKARRLSRKYKSKGKLSSDQDVSKLSSENTTSNLEAQPELISMKIPIDIDAEFSNDMMTGEDFMAEVNIPEAVVEGMTENVQEIVEKKDPSKAPGNLIECVFEANLTKLLSNEKARINSMEKRNCMDGDESVGEDSNLNREKSYRISRDVVSIVDDLPHSSPKSLDLSSPFQATTPSFLVPGQQGEKQIMPVLSNLNEKHKQEMNLEKERQDNYASEYVDELAETKNAAAPMNDNAAVVNGTTCTPNPIIVSEADFLPASPYHSLTRSGGRRRAKRKLSSTKRLKKMKCVKLSFSPTSKSLLPSNSLVVPDTESAVPLATTISLPSSPPIAPNLDSCLVHYSSAQLSKQDAKKSPVIEEDLIKIDQGLKASLEDDCSNKDVGKQVEATKSAQNDVCDKNEVNKSRKKIRRSSKKWLMSNKSLFLDVDVSESAPEESVSVQVLDKPDIPTYEDVYQRECAVVMNPDEKDTMGDTGKHVKSARRKSKTQVANKNVSSSHATKVDPLFEKDELPPLIVERKSTYSIKENSLLSTTLTSNKKFFKTSFRQSLDSSIACWREKSFFSGEKKKRKTYTKSFKVKARASGSSQMMDDPYSTSTISPGCPRNENSINRRKTVSPTISIPFRDNFVANDLEKESVGFSSSKPQGVVNKRKPSGIAGNSNPPSLGQSLSVIGNTLDQHPAQVTGKGDNNSEESIIVLSSTLRVLEMIARRSNITTELREIWGAIRSVAEREEKS